MYTSVIVDELARWKASLLHRSEESEHHIRLLLHEHSVLWRSLTDAFHLLSRLNTAFDPLADPARPAEGASLLGLADHVLELGRALRERLMGGGEKAVKDSEREVVKIGQLDTPAEEGLRKVGALILFSKAAFKFTRYIFEWLDSSNLYLRHAPAL